MQLILIVLMAISLSMDAFSLSIAYGTLGLNKKDNILLSVIVGIYHFIMPFIGLTIGSIILKYIKISPNIIVFIVLLLIGIEMIIESFKEKEEVKQLSSLEMLIFGFAVSVDSFSIGIGLNAVELSPIICFFIFSFTSLIFTYFGLFIGKKINNIVGKLSTILGGIMLIILGLIYLF